MPSSAWVHRVLVLFFVRQAIQVAGNITDIWCCSYIPPRPFCLSHISL
jgi:hypothetical protein